MAIRPIIEAPDPLLRQISSPVEEVNDELRKLIAIVSHFFDFAQIACAN